MRWSCASALAAALLLAAPARAERIVSLNLCTDQLLVRLAPEKVAALSFLARDPALSVVAPEAARLPTVRAEAEAVLRLHPDLVLAGTYGAQATLAALRAQGVRVVTFPDPQDFPAIAEQLRRAGDLFGHPGRARTLIEGMWATLRAILPRRPPRRAILWQAHGDTAGPATLGDAVLRAAGLINAGTGAVMGIETLMAHPPDLLVVEQAPAFPSLATDMLTHPAVAALPRRTLPPAWLACGTVESARAAAALAA